MINFFYTIFILCLFTVIGIGILKILRISEQVIDQYQLYYLAPLCGIFGVMIMVQILNLISPTAYLVVPLMIIGLGIIFVFRKEILKDSIILLKDKFLVGFIIISLLILEIPLIIKNELVSIQKFNNDIMYYLSTLDWFQGHSLLEPVEYSETSMYYWCAEYMIDLTRLGFDVLTSFMMSVLNLKSYQIFSIMGYVFITVACITAYYIMRCTLRLSSRVSQWGMVLILLGGGWIELITYQYCPQILGMTGLIAFFGVLLKLYENNLWTWKILTAFLITGTVTVYAEYAVYLLTIYLIIGAVNVVCTKGGIICKIRKVLPAIQMGFLALILNPVGILICIRFNVNTLLKASEDISQLDPYFGKVMTYPDAFARVFGLVLANKIDNVGIREIAYILLGILSIMWICILFLSFWRGIGNKNKDICSSVLVILFVSLYFLYFHNIRYGYGEFKHLATISPLVQIITIYLVYEYFKNFKSYYFKKWIKYAVVIATGLSFVVYLGHFYNGLYYFDSELEELGEAANLIPSDEPIGISGSTATVHGEIYALKNLETMLLANNVSYYPFSEVASTKYAALEKKDRENRPEIVENQENIVWNNNRFALVENEGIRCDFYSGFHDPETDGSEKWRWTCDKESIIVLKNYDSEAKKVRLRFYAESKENEKNEKVSVYMKKDKIAESLMNNYILTKEFSIQPGEEVEIRVVKQKGIRRNDIEGDDRELGFKMKEVQVLYDTEESA